MLKTVEVYAVTAVAMALITILFAIPVARKPSEKRRLYLPVVAIPAVSGFCFALMSQGILLVEQAEGAPAPVARMIGYLFIWPAMATVAGMAAGLDKRKIAVLAVLMSLVSIGILARWAPSPAIASIGPLLFLGSLVVISYLLLGPYNRLSKEVTGERQLLFGKLRNLLLLMWFFYVLTSLLIDSGLGFMDRFTSVFSANYLDLVAYTTFGIIVLQSEDAIDQLTGEYSSDSDDGSETTDEGPDGTDSPLADAAD